MSDSDPAEVTEDTNTDDVSAADESEFNAFADIYFSKSSDSPTVRAVLSCLRPVVKTFWLHALRRERAARREGAEAGLREPGSGEYACHDKGPDTCCFCGGPANGRRMIYHGMVSDHTNDYRHEECPRPAEPDRATESERDRLVRERDAARDALKFYADEKSWLFSDRSVVPPTMPALYDSGKRAREVLAQSGGGGGNP